MLSGSVPTTLSKLSLVEILYLHSHQLNSGSATTMPFLISLTNCSYLKELRLRDNKLAGALPLAIGKFSTNLSYLTLANNLIEGNIPPDIRNISSLTYVMILNRNTSDNKQIIHATNYKNEILSKHPYKSCKWRTSKPFYYIYASQIQYMMEWCTWACLKGQGGPNPGRKMVELKAAQLLHQSALHCLETTALLEFEWLEGVLKLPRNLYAFNLSLLGQNPQKSINGLT